MEARPPQEWVDYWTEQIKKDLKARSAMYDKNWQRDEYMVRNTERGFRHGNLVQEFIKMVHRRLFSKPVEINIKPDDAQYAEEAEDAEVVASAVDRVAGMDTAYKQAAVAATWAGVGFVEVGHPLDPWSLDPMRSGRSPNLPMTQSGGPVDDYQEVSPTEMQAYGVPPEQVQPFDAFSTPPASPEQAEPLPLFNPALGNSWACDVDPRLVVFPPRLKSFTQAPYYARLRFITQPELEQVSGVQVKSMGCSEYADLFSQTEGCELREYPEMLLVADVWIVRDRNNPHYNNYRFQFAFGAERELIAFGKNPYGGLINLIPVQLTETKGVYDTPPARELAEYADIYHKGIKAMARSVTRMLNRKYWKAQGHGLTPKGEQNFLNPDFTGMIDAAAPDAIKPEPKEEFDAALFQSLAWVRGAAQAGAGASDIDVGRAVKDITARQTEALLQSTGINVDSMKTCLQRARAEGILKLMYLTGAFNHQGRARAYHYGRNMVSYDQGTHDFTTSLVYAVQVVDAGDVLSNEERMTWLQFWRTLQSDTTGLFVPYYDKEFLARTNLRKFGIGPEGLASRNAGREGQGSEAPGVVADRAALAQNGGSTPPNLSVAPGGVAALQEMLGQHPERALGSRGPGPAQAVSGLRRIGTGMGERR